MKKLFIVFLLSISLIGCNKINETRACKLNDSDLEISMIEKNGKLKSYHLTASRKLKKNITSKMDEDEIKKVSSDLLESMEMKGVTIDTRYDKKRQSILIDIYVDFSKVERKNYRLLGTDNKLSAKTFIKLLEKNGLDCDKK